MKVSIALATYNGAKYLGNQLESFLHQTKLPDELIVSDDHSHDSTMEILNDFKNKAPFEVKLFKNKGSGFNDNFENALFNCLGELIFISDQDDKWLPNKIECMHDYFIRNQKCQVLIHDLEFCDSNLNKIGQKKIERISIYDSSLENYVTGMATAVRKNFLDLCMPIPACTNYDNWIHYCAEIIDSREVIDNVLALYRRHSENATLKSFVNKSTKINKTDIYKKKMQKSQVQSFQNQSEIIENILVFLQRNREELLSDFGVKDIENYKTNLIQKRKLVEMRIDILNLQKISRLPKALNLWFIGGYSMYGGISSLLKDLI